jgi:glycerophosphoryl diester phosphodiesterase
MEVVAWRGSSARHLENTLSAVMDVPDWVKWIEIDTRLSSDGKLFAYHSPTMRVHGDPRSFDQISSAELLAKRIIWRKREYSIPLVRDLLEKAPADKKFILHVKRETDPQAYVSAVKFLPRRVYFHSNSVEHLQALFSEGVALGTGGISLGLFKSVYTPEEPILDFVHGYFCGHKAFMPVSSLEDSWLAKLRSLNKKLFVFASHSEKWMREVVQHDVDGFLTGRFDRAQSVLSALSTEIPCFVKHLEVALARQIVGLGVSAEVLGIRK